jgi:hypothetical protein
MPTIAADGEDEPAKGRTPASIAVALAVVIMVNFFA